MKRKALFLQLIILILNHLASGQSNSYISFCAENGIIGHAFISLSQENPEKRMTEFHGAWGLYPKGEIQGGKSLFIGEVPGEIRSDLLTKQDKVLTRIVTKEQFSKAKIILGEWRKKNYELLKQDCLSFIIEIANILSNEINIPERVNFENHPSLYIERLIELNK